MKTDITMGIYDLKMSIDLNMAVREMDELMHKLYPI